MEITHTANLETTHTANCMAINSVDTPEVGEAPPIEGEHGRTIGTAVVVLTAVLLVVFVIFDLITVTRHSGVLVGNLRHLAERLWDLDYGYSAVRAGTGR